MQHSEKWTPDKARRRAQKAQGSLVAGETIWFVGPCNNLRPVTDALVITSARVLGLSGPTISFEARHGTIRTVVPDGAKQSITVATDTTSMTFKLVPREDHDRIGQWINYGATVTPSAQLVAGLEARAGQIEQHELSTGTSWPESTVVVGRVSAKAGRAVRRVCHSGKAPWLILSPSGATGVLAAFDDRVAIIKTGAMTSMMAGSLGGERTATFHYADITGLEYNSGFMNGVLEILTPSYDGSANKDFWRGSTSSRNANSNDPFTLSNTLPLPKAEYTRALTHINEMRRLISEAKRPTVQVVSAPPLVGASSVSEEIERLAGLFDRGVLTAEEFTAAKNAVIARMP